MQENFLQIRFGNGQILDISSGECGQQSVYIATIEKIHAHVGFLEITDAAKMAEIYSALDVYTFSIRFLTELLRCHRQ